MLLDAKRCSRDVPGPIPNVAVSEPTDGDRLRSAFRSPICHRHNSANSGCPGGISGRGISDDTGLR